MDRPGELLLTYIPEIKSWCYEYVYSGTREHKGNLDIFYLRNGEVIDKALDLKEVIIHDTKEPRDYAIRIHSQ